MKATFFWVPGTGESYPGDKRTDVLATNSMGSRIVEVFSNSIDSVWVGYDATYGPVGSGGLYGKNYHLSKMIGKVSLLEKIRATEGWVILGGHSQGSAVVWEVMQEIYQGKHPDIQPRVLASLKLACPMRAHGVFKNSETIVTHGDALSLSGWGVANRSGTQIEPTIFELNVVNPEDVICNARPDSLARDIADITKYFAFGQDQEWGRHLLRELKEIDIFKTPHGRADMPTQIRRVGEVLKELEGFLLTGQHTGYGNAAKFPYLQMDGTIGSITNYAGRYLESLLPQLISEAEQRASV